MQKKKFDLTPDIVEVKLEDSLKLTENTSLENIKSEDKKSILLSIAVEPEIRKEYKSWCAKKGLKMNEAFLKGFNLLKKFDNI